MVNKTIITKELNKLYNWKVFTFNSQHKMPTGTRGFVDHVLINKNGYIVFIEVKIGNDKLSEKQKEYQEVYEKIMQNNKMFKYYIMTEKNYIDIIKDIYFIGE